MKIVIQRVSSASVTIGGALRCAIGPGLLVLVGVGHEDGADDVEYLVKKTAALRIFDDEAGVMNRSVIEAGGDVIVVSQFTLMASTRKGNRPAYIAAAPPEVAVPLYEDYCRRLSEAIGKPVGTGVFGADMQVALVNDGPVTICIDSKNR
ncbi:MAG: D-tyrosyl-tRNA(Tyr) deacylase [Bacteroidales bacterium]|nr:D-tyrosyl-tRNA(Tyr) deacylase [Bacteroidales bacterium]